MFALSSFVLTVIWIATNVYHSQAESTIEPLLQTQIIPIEPGFDEKAISELRKRAPVEPSMSAPIAVSSDDQDSILVPTEESGSLVEETIEPEETQIDITTEEAEL